IHYRVLKNYSVSQRTAQIVLSSAVHFDITQAGDTGLAQPFSVTPFEDSSHPAPACSSGSECPQRFDFVFHGNSDGAYDVNDIYINFSYRAGIYADGCFMEIERSDTDWTWGAILWVIGGPGSQIIVGPATLGSGGVLENPQCKVDIGGADI